LRDWDSSGSRGSGGAAAVTSANYRQQAKTAAYNYAATPAEAAEEVAETCTGKNNDTNRKTNSFFY